MNRSAFEDILREKGELIYTSAGNSMYPLIMPRDLLVIKKWDGTPLKKYDIPLYRRDSGQYVLHRVIKVRQNDYVLCGDNRRRKESGITEKNIIGVLTAIIRDGKTLPIDSPDFRRYAKTLFWRRLKLTIKDRI